jgi:hypothetical protein
LQAWCHQLTKSSRERAAKTFMKQLGAFASDIRQYVAGIGQVTSLDRESLREKWESGEQDAPEPIDEQDPFTAILGGTGLYTMPQSAPKRDRYGELIGITPRLIAVRPKQLTFALLRSTLARNLARSLKRVSSR